MENIVNGNSELFFPDFDFYISLKTKLYCFNFFCTSFLILVLGSFTGTSSSFEYKTDLYLDPLNAMWASGWMEE